MKITVPILAQTEKEFADRSPEHFSAEELCYLARWGDDGERERDEKYRLWVRYHGGQINVDWFTLCRAMCRRNREDLRWLLALSGKIKEGENIADKILAAVYEMVFDRKLGMLWDLFMDGITRLKGRDTKSVEEIWGDKIYRGSLWMESWPKEKRNWGMISELFDPDIMNRRLLFGDPDDHILRCYRTLCFVDFSGIEHLDWYEEFLGLKEPVKLSGFWLDS